MARFDFKAWSAQVAKEAFENAKPELLAFIANEKDVAQGLEKLALDVDATFEAMATENDEARLENLRRDLQTFLPARRAHLVSLAATRAGSTEQALLEAVLVGIEKAAIVVAKAYLPIPGGFSFG